MEDFIQYISDNRKYVFTLVKMVNKLRDDKFTVAVGDTATGHPDLLETGYNYELINLAVGGWNGIVTSPLQSVTLISKDTFKIHTLNSIYLLTKIKL